MASVAAQGAAVASTWARAGHVARLAGDAELRDGGCRRPARRTARSGRGYRRRCGPAWCGTRCTPRSSARRAWRATAPAGAAPARCAAPTAARPRDTRRAGRSARGRARWRTSRCSGDATPSSGPPAAGCGGVRRPVPPSRGRRTPPTARLPGARVPSGSRAPRRPARRRNRRGRCRARRPASSSGDTTRARSRTPRDGTPGTCPTRHSRRRSPERDDRPLPIPARAGSW